MGKKEKSTFASWQHSRNRKISCTATFVLPLSDTFVAGIEERQKLKQNHLRSMHWTTSNLSILYYTKQWRQDWLAFQGTVLWEKKSWFFRWEFKNLNFSFCKQCMHSEVLPYKQKPLLFQVRQQFKYQQLPCQIILNIMFPPLNSSHEHPSEQEEQLSDMKDRRTCFPHGKSL